MEIPYTADARPDTGFTNGRLGTWLFVASEAMLFGALFSGYALLRTGSAAWPRGADRLDLTLGLVCTALMIGSSAFVAAAVRRAARDDRHARRLTWSAVVCGAAFTAVTMAEWRHVLRAGYGPATDNFYATWFTLTGVHALHVAGGAIALAGAGLRDAVTFARRLPLVGIYWQFVDAVWLVLFVLFYLW